MSSSIVDRVYPERRLFGFTRCDGTVHFFQRVQALLAPGSVVLDVGCGRGARAEDSCRMRRSLATFTDENRKVIGIDVDPRAATNPLINEFRLIDDVAHWPVADASIDLVFSDYVIEHVEKPQVFFSEAYRVCKPGGYICLRTPNFLSPVGFATWCIPNRLHTRILSHLQPKRNEVDIFPTVYRCNTRRRLKRLLADNGFEAVVYSIEPEPGYLERAPILYRVAAAVFPRLPSLFQANLIAFGKKRES